MPQTITVALDGSKERNLQFYSGDDMSLTLVVYLLDGDVTPATVTNVRFASYAGDVPVGVDFVVPSNYIGRAAYRIIGDIDGITQTLVYGILTTDCGWPDLCGDCCYPSGNSWGGAAKADNVSLLDEGAYFAALASVETALQELGAFKALISAQVGIANWGFIGGTLSVQTDLQAALDAKGYLDIPQNSVSAAYTFVLADRGKHVFHPSADVSARIWTIPANSVTPFPIGSAITVINQNLAGIITLAINTDVLRWSPAGTSGSRAIAPNGIATMVKYTATEWLLSGSGIS